MTALHTKYICISVNMDKHVLASKLIHSEVFLYQFLLLTWFLTLPDSDEKVILHFFLHHDQFYVT